MFVVASSPSNGGGFALVICPKPTAPTRHAKLRGHLPFLWFHFIVVTALFGFRNWQA
jgi:hypothetical protein